MEETKSREGTFVTKRGQMTAQSVWRGSRPDRPNRGGPYTQRSPGT